jgi:nucleoside-diphosphate-sugar epimerase
LRVLITGGCGFVGRHFARALLERGHHVVVVDPLTHGSGALAPAQWPSIHRGAGNEVEWIELDCRSYFSQVSADNFDVVLHLAAIVGGRLSIERAALAVAQDLAIDAAMFEWAATTGARRVVYFSSSAAYPIALQDREHHRLLVEADIDFSRDIGVPDLSYGWSKLTGEFLGRLAAQRYQLPVAAYRPFSGYGEDQDLNYPFPSLVSRVLAHRSDSPFVVWGSGRQERDFIHIDDCVEFVLATYEGVSDGGAMNLSSGVSTSFNTLAETIARIADTDIGIIENDTTKPEGVFSRIGDTALQAARGLKPSVGLEDGIRRVLAFQDEEGARA